MFRAIGIAQTGTHPEHLMSNHVTPTASTVAPIAQRPRCNPDRLARLQAAAAAHGGACLDEMCAKLQAKYRFRCAKGHEWLGWGHLVLVGKWCRLCANERQRRTIEDMHEAARRLGGQCLSTEYLGHAAKLTWRCEFGHVWHATPRTVQQRGTWCPHCTRLRRRAALRESALSAPQTNQPAEPSKVFGSR
ncbi:zinc-ribbon domain-containing protein [Paraburkholderia megapolitana]